jgi:hypothetical protein
MNINLGLPTDYSLTASISFRGENKAVAQIVISLPLSGRATDDFFRGKTLDHTVQTALDTEYIDSITRKPSQEVDTLDQN